MASAKRVSPIRQTLHVVGAERQKASPLRLEDDRDGAVDERFARIGELDPDRAAVGRLRQPRDEVQALELVQAARQPGAAEKELSRELLRRKRIGSAGTPEGGQDIERPAREPERRQRLVDERGGAKMQLAD